MSCVNWAALGETGMKKPSSWGGVAISRTGLQDGSKSLHLYFLTNYQISLFTHYSLWFFFLLSPRSCEVSVQFPSCLVLSCVAAMLFGGHRLHLFANNLCYLQQPCRLWWCSIKFFNIAPGSKNVWRKEKRSSSDLSASIFSCLEIK